MAPRYLVEHPRDRVLTGYTAERPGVTSPLPSGETWLRTRESNPAKKAYEAFVMHQLNLPAIKQTWYRQMESNHLMPPYQDGAHPESLAGVEPGGRLELPCQPYQSCGSPSILARRGSGDGSRTHSAALRVPYAAVNISPEQNNMEPISGLEPDSRGYRPRTSPSTLDRQTAPAPYR